MRRIALFSLGCVLAAGHAFGEELKWQPAGQAPAATIGRPVSATLGAPQSARQSGQPIIRAQAGDTPALGVPEPGYPQAAYYPPPVYNYPPPNYPPPGYYPPPAYPYPYPPPAYNYPPPNYPPPQSTSARYRDEEPRTAKGDPVRRTSFSSRRSKSNFAEEGVQGWWDGCCDGVTGFCTEGGRTLFQSDHCMDFFASPVTNPFLFEDPRALTEIRPIFLWQTIPGSNPVFQGGNAYFYGMQARIALTDWLSFTLNKLGGVTIDPDNSALNDASGLAELHLGPKFTFIRNVDWGTAVAAGAIFQIPVGPSSVFQDTGSFSIVPYITGAQNFCRNSYGSFNVMNTFGYSFGVGGGRSDYLYNSIHLDFDVVNAHRFYPFLEMNWFHYTSNGDSRPITQEGRDFANFGGTGISGNDYLTIAPGFRYKFSENVQLGLATEFPLTSPRDIQEFRFLVDMIFRY